MSDSRVPILIALVAWCELLWVLLLLLKVWIERSDGRDRPPRSAKDRSCPWNEANQHAGGARRRDAGLWVIATALGESSVSSSIWKHTRCVRQLSGYSLLGHSDPPEQHAACGRGSSRIAHGTGCFPFHSTAG
jgi:hypothetical protein